MPIYIAIQLLYTNDLLITIIKLPLDVAQTFTIPVHISIKSHLQISIH